MFLSRSRTILRGIVYPLNTINRNFLSNVYESREAWNERLGSPVIHKVKFEYLYTELEIKFNAKKPVSFLDIDIFANKINNDEYLIELEELIHKFRQSPNTIKMYDSTSHAVIRTFLEFGSTDNLMRMLDDRMNYGIFPDHFTYNLMMNRFLKQKNYRDAAKTAALLMIQEDYNSSLTNILALYSCYMYLNNPNLQPWDPFSATEESKDDDEDQWVRVKYIPLDYFDDHFDLRKPNHIIGKTLIGLTKMKVVEDTGVNQSFKLLASVLFEKWDHLKECVELIIKDKDMKVYKQCFDKALKFILEVADEEKKKEIEKKIVPLLKQIVDSGKLIDDDLQKILADKVKQQVDLHQKADIENMKSMYKRWIENRENDVKAQIIDHVKQERLKKIYEKMEQLKKKEELLFFFGNIEKHRLNIPPEEEDQMITQDGKLSSKSLLDVPPEIEGKVGRYSSKIIEEHEPWWRWKEYKKEETDEKKQRTIIHILQIRKLKNCENIAALSFN